jgi:hypothetical protein
MVDRHTLNESFMVADLLCDSGKDLEDVGGAREVWKQGESWRRSRTKSGGLWAEE